MADSPVGGATPAQPRPSVPGSITFARVVLWIQAGLGLLAAMAIALAFTGLGLVSEADAPGPNLGSRLSGLFAIVFAVVALYPAALSVLAIFLGRPGRRWVWLATAILQIGLVIVQAIGALTSQRAGAGFGLLLAAPALVVLLALVTPSARRFHWRT